MANSIIASSGMFVMFADDKGAAGGIIASMGAFLFVYLALIVLIIVALWKIFTKAGQPGWAAIVPIYNSYILIVEICKMPILWFILALIPCTAWIAAIMAALKLAEKFGKEVGFAIGLILLPFIFYPILAFGSATYEGGGRKKRRSRDEEDEEE
jgi:hypothetical protein